jgi:hypothetical protein
MTSTLSTNRKAQTSWKEWFLSRDSAAIINKSNQEKLFSTFNSTISNSKCIESLIQHEETVFLHKVNFGEKKVNTFHHLTSVGGTIYDSTEKEYGFIQGIGETTATSMTTDIEVLCKTPTQAPTAIPSVTQILTASTEEQIDSLTVSATVTYAPRNFIPVPPFLLDPIQETVSKSNGNSKLVLIECIKSIKNFDTSNANNTEYVDKAKSKCKDILFWLYLVSKDYEHINPTPSMGCNNEALASALSIKKQQCLNVSETLSTQDSISAQVENSLKRPFEVLAASSSSTSEFMEKLTQLQSTNNEKSTKSFRKIPTKYQNMILVASSVGEVTELDYSADAAEFFKCSNTLHAQVMLNSQFETEGIECSASSAVTATLMFGSFLWRNALSPSGFAASVLSSEGIFRTDTLHEGMVLDYATKFDMSSASLNKLTKSQVLYPTDAEETIQRVRGIHLLAKFFFKKSGYMSQGLKRLSIFCMDNKMLLRKMIFMDSHFTAKFICAIDERIYIWLQQCSQRDSVVDTDLSLMDFSPLIQDIQLNRFNYMLPPSISKISNDQAADSSTKKKQGRNNEDTAKPVRNPNINKDWKLRPNEKWDTVFKNMTLTGPTLSLGCKPCLKYQVKGICYDDCRQICSHRTLSDEDKALTDKFIKELRGE